MKINSNRESLQQRNPSGREHQSIFDQTFPCTLLTLSWQTYTSLFSHPHKTVLHFLQKSIVQAGYDLYIRLSTHKKKTGQKLKMTEYSKCPPEKVDKMEAQIQVRGNSFLKVTKHN